MNRGVVMSIFPEDLAFMPMAIQLLLVQEFIMDRMYPKDESVLTPCNINTMFSVMGPVLPNIY